MHRLLGLGLGNRQHSEVDREEHRNPTGATARSKIPRAVGLCGHEETESLDGSKKAELCVAPSSSISGMSQPSNDSSVLVAREIAGPPG